MASTSHFFATETLYLLLDAVASRWRARPAISRIPLLSRLTVQQPKNGCKSTSSGHAPSAPIWSSIHYREPGSALGYGNCKLIFARRSVIKSIQLSIRHCCRESIRVVHAWTVPRRPLRRSTKHQKSKALAMREGQRASVSLGPYATGPVRQVCFGSGPRTLSFIISDKRGAEVGGLTTCDGLLCAPLVRIISNHR